MLSEEEKAFYNKRIKQYRELKKVAIVFMSLPIGILIYCLYTYESDDVSVSLLIFGIIILVAGYIRVEFFQIHADILNEIINKPGFEEQSKPEKKT